MVKSFGNRRQLFVVSAIKLTFCLQQNSIAQVGFGFNNILFMLMPGFLRKKGSPHFRKLPLHLVSQC